MNNRTYSDFPAVVLAVFAIIFSTAISADAKCSVPSFKAALKTAHSVFLGKVLSDAYEGDIRYFEFEVEKSWKGERSKRITIAVAETLYYQAWYRVGERYLIYAEIENGKLWVDRCSRSRLAGSASADIRKLGAGKNPAK